MSSVSKNTVESMHSTGQTQLSDIHSANLRAVVKLKFCYEKSQHISNRNAKYLPTVLSFLGYFLAVNDAIIS